MHHKDSKILDPSEREELWKFYQDFLGPLNEKSPLAQTLGKVRFMSWLSSSRALKYTLRENGQLMGLLIVSGDLRHDPLISRSYFRKHYLGRRIYHCPAIVIHPDWQDGRGIQFLAEAFAELPRGSVAIFFHSEVESPLIPRFAGIAGRGRFVVRRVDAVACCVCLEVDPKRG